MTFDKAQFARAIELWTEWNAKINVVSRKDIDNLYEHHILHSLAIVQYLAGLPSGGKNEGGMPPFGHNLPASETELLSADGIAAGETFLDVGCGGGFPGVPLAMVLSGARFTLCDSVGKKVKVAQAVADALGLANVECVNARAEDIPGQFDWVVSRAVTSLDNFYPWVRGKFRKGILCLKGGDVDEEISRMCGKCGVNPSKVTVRPVSEWIDDDYFAEKFVIHVRK